MTLALIGQIRMPDHPADGFDHGDVHTPTGRVFVAHMANGTVEVIDGDRLTVERTLPGCPDASGVLCVQNGRAMVFAAARSAGNVLVIDPTSCEVQQKLEVGPSPNGLAWDPDSQHLLVADVQSQDARLIDPEDGTCLTVHAFAGSTTLVRVRPATAAVPGHVRDPACLLALSARDLLEVGRFAEVPAGPHGLDLDRARNRAFVACDAAEVAVLDLTIDQEIARMPISGEPDAIWFSAAANRLYVAIGDPGVIDGVDGEALSVMEEVATERGAHTTAFDSQRHRLYVFLPRSCQTSVYQESLSASQ